MRRLEKNWLEWCVFGVGSLLVLATVAYLAYEAVTSKGRPATVEVRLGTAERRGEEFAVPVSVINRGDQSAEAVHVEVQLRGEGGEVERSNLQIQLLPGRATRHGWATFQSDPAQAAEMSGRAIGFQTP